MFSDLLWISEQKRIRLLYKKIRQGCKDGNLTVQDVIFEYQNCFWETLWKFSVIEQKFVRLWQKTIGRIVKTAFQVSTGIFYATFFCEKMSLLLLLWILLEKTAKFPQINLGRVVATVFYLSKNKKKHSTTKIKFVFRKKHNFQTILSCEPVQLDFWQKKIGSVLRIAFYVSQKETGRRKFDLRKFFRFTLDFWAKKNQIVV